MTFTDRSDRTVQALCKDIVKKMNCIVQRVSGSAGTVRGLSRSPQVSGITSSSLFSMSLSPSAERGDKKKRRKKPKLNKQYHPAQFHLVDKAGITAAGPGNFSKPFGFF